MVVRTARIITISGYGLGKGRLKTTLRQRSNKYRKLPQTILTFSDDPFSIFLCFLLLPSVPLPALCRPRPNGGKG